MKIRHLLVCLLGYASTYYAQETSRFKLEKTDKTITFFDPLHLQSFADFTHQLLNQAASIEGFEGIPEASLPKLRKYLSRKEAIYAFNREGDLPFRASDGSDSVKTSALGYRSFVYPTFQVHYCKTYDEIVFTRTGTEWTRVELRKKIANNETICVASFPFEAFRTTEFSREIIPTQQMKNRIHRYQVYLGIATKRFDVTYLVPPFTAFEIIHHYPFEQNPTTSLEKQYARLYKKIKEAALISNAVVQRKLVYTPHRGMTMDSTQTVTIDGKKETFIPYQELHDSTYFFLFGWKKIEYIQAVHLDAQTGKWQTSTPKIVGYYPIKHIKPLRLELYDLADFATLNQEDPQQSPSFVQRSYDYFNNPLIQDVKNFPQEQIEFKWWNQLMNGGLPLVAIPD